MVGGLVEPKRREGLVDQRRRLASMCATTVVNTRSCALHFARAQTLISTRSSLLIKHSQAVGSLCRAL